jgi:hypothetical protein
MEKGALGRALAGQALSAGLNSRRAFLSRQDYRVVLGNVTGLVNEMHAMGMSIASERSCWAFGELPLACSR